MAEKNASDSAKRIADELASCGVKLVASLPDNWVMDLINTIEHDDRFIHVPVNREESAIGLCSGAYMGAMGSAALMGASGFMTVVYALTKINYTYEIPLFLMATLRGAGRRPSQASRFQRALSAAGAGRDQHALSDHRQGRGHRPDLAVLSPHAHLCAPDGGAVHARSAAREPLMKYLECFRALARHRTDEIVVASAGNSCQAWWAATRDSDASFYLDASMSLSTMFASGLALARPELKIWAFMGDGAFCMNPGMLMVERQMNLPNLTHFLVSNRVYGATSNAGLPNVGKDNDYAAIARGMGWSGCSSSHSVEELERDFPALKAANAPGHTFVVLEVEPFSDEEQKLEQPPFDGPELKFRFGRHIESLTGAEHFRLSDIRTRPHQK